MFGNKLIQIFVTIGVMGCQTACASEFVTWQEEVKLNDGRVIVVTQKKRCEGAYTGGNYAKCIAREAWLTIRLPEFSKEEIVWHENLDALVLNVYGGKLFVIGWPHTGREFSQYGKPQPPYIGFVFERGQWKRIPFTEIPEAVYDTNMLIEGIPPAGTEFLTIEKKESKDVNGKLTYPPYFRRVDPKFKY